MFYLGEFNILQCKVRTNATHLKINSIRIFFTFANIFVVSATAHNCYNTSARAWDCHHQTRALGKMAMVLSFVDGAHCAGCAGRNQISFAKFRGVL